MSYIHVDALTKQYGTGEAAAGLTCCEQRQSEHESQANMAETLHDEFLLSSFVNPDSIILVTILRTDGE